MQGARASGDAMHDITQATALQRVVRRLIRARETEPPPSEALATRPRNGGGDDVLAGLLAEH